jgi:hypothetical protein
MNAIADTFEIDKLEFDPEASSCFKGTAVRFIDFFCDAKTSWQVTATIVDSVYFEKRSMAVVMVHLMGGLYANLIVDGEKDEMELRIIAGEPVGLVGNRAVEFLPAHWLRVDLYRKLVKGVRASYWKNVYDPKWVKLSDGNAEMLTYIDKKKTIQSGKGHTTYVGTERVDSKHDVPQGFKVEPTRLGKKTGPEGPFNINKFESEKEIDRKLEAAREGMSDNASPTPTSDPDKDASVPPEAVAR